MNKTDDALLGINLFLFLIFIALLFYQVKDLSVKVEQCMKDTQETKEDMKSYIKFFDSLDENKSNNSLDKPIE